MGRSKRSRLAIDGSLEAARIAAALGRDLRAARRRRRFTQASIAARVGMTQGRISDLERGQGATASLGSWVLLGLAVGRPLAMSLSRDLAAAPEGPADAGHLEIQEFLLASVAVRAKTRRVELPTRPADPSRSIDVCLIDDGRGLILMLEAWNRIGDLGAAIRATHRKVAEAEGLRNVLEGQTRRTYRVVSCWIVRATAANRSIVGSYPAIMRSALPASSSAWVAALTSDASPPPGGGLVWFDSSRRRLSRVRLPVSA